MILYLFQKSDETDTTILFLPAHFMSPRINMGVSLYYYRAAEKARLF